MRIGRRLLTLAAASGVLLLPMSDPAMADSYPIPPHSFTCSPTTITVDDRVDCVGTNFGAGESVRIDETSSPTALGRAGGAVAPVAYTMPLRRPVTTMTANGSGGFTVTVELNRVGTAVIAATGRSTGRTASATILVLAAGSSLPVTGDGGGYLGMLLIGSAVAAAGLVLVVLARTRRRPTRLHS
jgi:hypothetical protein